MRCGGRVRPVLRMWSTYDVVAARPVGVCPVCGHVQAAALPSPAEYERINNNYFSERYANATKGRRQGRNQRKAAQTMERLAGRVGAGGAMLDVGAGDGWGQQVAQRLGLRYHALEADPTLAGQLAQAGAVIAPSDLAELARQHAGRFDLIIMRHVLEHLLDPIGALTHLAQCLSQDGVFYAALPNLRTFRPKQGLRTDFFRPIHISYFTANKLAWCLAQAGLRPQWVDGQGELWTVARPGQAQVRLLNEGPRNRALIQALKRGQLWPDLRNIALIMQSRLRRGGPV